MGVGGVGLVSASALRGGTDGGTAGMQQQNGGVCVWLECVQFSDSVTQPTPPPPLAILWNLHQQQHGDMFVRSVKNQISSCRSTAEARFQL